MSAEAETYIYKTVGDCRIKADVYRPPVAVSGGSPARPLIVHIHGGCLMYGCRTGIHSWHVDRYTQAGYTVVSIDYRLAPESKIPAIIEDLDDAFTWVADQGPELFGIDPTRIATIGHSAGGYLALMSGFATQVKPKAIVAFYGYGDLIGDWYSKPDPYYCQQPSVSEEQSGIHTSGPVISEPYEGRGKDGLYLYCRQNGLWPDQVGGHNPHTEPEFFTPYCPVQNVTADYPSTLLLHGDEDTDVPYQLSVLMADEIQRHKGDGELITMAGRGHGFDHKADDPIVQEAMDRVIGFLNSRV